MTKPEPLDCCCPDDVRFTTVTTDGSISLATSTIGSAPAGTVTGALDPIALGTGVGTSSAGVRPSNRVAVAPPAIPPTITPISRSAAPLGPVERGGGLYGGIGAGSYIGGGSTSADAPEFRPWAWSPCGGARSVARPPARPSDRGRYRGSRGRRDCQARS